MVLRISFYMEFSHLQGGLEHSADGNSIPQNLTTTFLSNPDCNETAGVSSFTRRTARSAIPFVSER